MFTSKHIGSEYMELTELEQKVILKFAEEGLLSGYDFHLAGKRVRGTRKALMSSGYWPKVKKHLIDEGLIVHKKIKGRSSGSESGKDKRGRRKDLHWLTEKGLVVAILHGANLNLLLNHVRKAYPNNEENALLVELTGVIGKKLLRTAYSVMQTNEVDLQMILGLVVTTAFSLSKEQTSKMLSDIDMVLRKYPSYHIMFKSKIKNSVNELKKLAL